MRIRDVTCTVLGAGAGRGYPLVRVWGEDGLVGIGEASPMSPHVTRAVVEHQLKPLLVGMDALDLEACWEKAGAFVHQQIIWVKDRGVLTRSHYLWKHEPCFMGWRRPNRPPKVAEQTLPSTWEMPSFAKDERPDHPTPKPLDAFGIPMRQHVARGGLCYEPFSGSGSQIMAGEANGRRIFAMEISPAYVDVAVERWQAGTDRDAILDGDGRTFAQVKAERRGDDADASSDMPGTAPEPARKRKTTA